MKRLVWSALASLSLAVPMLAYASDGYVTGNVNLRAGPDPSYPLVDQLPAGTEIDVQGCTDGWEWCDVINDGDGSRGWIAGNFIQYEYQDQPVLLSDYGAEIGIPIVAFTIGAYWDNYYRGRPFYRDRATWYNRPMPHRPPPRPMSDGGRQWHGQQNQNRPAQQYQRQEQPNASQQHGQNSGQWHGSNENRPAQQYERPQQQQTGNRPAPQYQRAEQVREQPQQRGPNPGARPEQAAQNRGQPQAHPAAKPAERKDDHGDNNGH